MPDHVLLVDPAHRADLHNRLSRIEGQIRGIKRMVDEPRPCLEVLQQLAAVSAAIDRVRVSVFRFHVRRCVPAAVKKGGREQAGHLSELEAIVDQFCR